MTHVEPLNYSGCSWCPGMKNKKVHAGRVRTRLTVVVTTLAVFLFTVIAINLKGGAKQVRYQLDHRLDVSNPEFLRSMGSLLGPAIIGGNEVKAYHNGDQIFPPMLEAIRAAEKT